MCSNEELSKLLFEELKSMQESYFSYVIGTTATFILACGWFMTSENAQNLLRGNRKVIRFIASILSVIWISYAFSDYRILVCSRQTGEQLRGIMGIFTSPAQFEHRIMRADVVVAMLLGRLLIFLIFILLLRYIHLSKPKAKDA